MNANQSKLEHAYLQVFEPSSVSVTKPGAPLDRINFQFNPKELTMSKTASWEPHKSKNVKSAAPPQYKGPEPSKMSLEMFFDASVEQDDSVATNVDRLFACCVPTSDSRSKQTASAPWVLFRWGKLTGFHAYIKTVQAKYTLFTAAGVPIRATVTVSLEEIAGEKPKQNPTSGGIAPRKVHSIREGDTLAAIAWAEYGDASLWRALADVNRIDDPARLRVGASVFVPTMDELLRPARATTAAREVARVLR